MQHVTMPMMRVSSVAVQVPAASPAPMHSASTGLAPVVWLAV